MRSGPGGRCPAGGGRNRAKAKGHFTLADLDRALLPGRLTLPGLRAKRGGTKPPCELLHPSGLLAALAASISRRRVWPGSQSIFWQAERYESF
ncbi:MAG: hypothetical protein JW999_03070 [Methanotrichaceae archaeon]|nr:hypothetical protein [Methanotrichaceae archaeon]